MRVGFSTRQVEETGRISGDLIFVTGQGAVGEELGWRGVFGRRC